MTEWKACVLGDVIDVKHGFAFKGEYFSDAGTHIVLTPGNFFDDGGFKSKGDKEKWYTGPIPRDYVLDEGDLIVAMTEQAEGLLGCSATIPRSGIFLHNQRLGEVLVKEPAQAEKRFLYYLFNTKPVRQQIRGSASGTKIRHTSPSRIAEVKVALPDLPTQRRIAGILSAYDELIANNQRRIAVLEQMARALYREWFVYYRAPGVVMKEGEELPEGWEVKKLGEIADIRKGLSYKGEFLDDEAGAPMVNMKCITPGGGFRRDGVKGYTGPFKEHQSVRPGDIVFANTDLTQAGFIIGSAALVPRLGFEDGGLATHHICIAHERTGIASKGFLYFTINDERFREFARGRASGTTVLGFRTSDAEDYDVQLPPSQIMERFTAMVQPILDLIETRAEQVANLRRTRDLLLPRLMGGRVELNNVEP